MDFAHSYAIIIGINKYGNGIRELRSAVSDAEALARLLEAKHGYSVKTLLDAQATRDKLEAHFTHGLPKPDPGDRFIIYFAGHGIAEESDSGPTGYLLPQDASADNRNSFLDMDIFRQWLGLIRCRHLLVILDCCFAGAFRWTKETRHVRRLPEKIYQQRYDRFIKNPARQVIVSAAYNQEALDVVAGQVLGSRRPDKNPGAHSPFAQVLLDGLGGAADIVPSPPDGVITAYELAAFLRDKVSLSANQASHEQMPCLWTLGREQAGEFIFLAPGHPLNLESAKPLDKDSNPYRGLHRYGPEDADLFFGRDQVVEDLATTVAKQPLTLVVGASGTGKSSLVLAGLLAWPKKRAAAPGDDPGEAADPRSEPERVPASSGGCPDEAADAVLFGLDPAAGGVFQRIIMRPADAPATPVRALLARVGAGSTEPGVAPSGTLADDPPEAAIDALAGWLEADTRRHLLIVVDQLEELVTLCAPKVRERFLDCLAGLLDREQARLRVILTLRSDFAPQFADSPLERHMGTDGSPGPRFVVPPLRSEELRQVIEGPAGERVLFFEPLSLVDRLIDDVNNMPGALPLLSFALSELYLAYLARQEGAQSRGEIIDRAITEGDYQKLGGVVGALSKRADEEYKGCDAAHQATMRRVMLRMVATEGDLARRRVPLAELEYSDPAETTRASTVVKKLGKARLVVAGRAERSNGNGETDADYVEPAHDALVRAWGKLLEWQREAAAELTVQRQLSDDAGEWVRQAHATGLLWTADPRLPLVRQHLEAKSAILNRREAEFVEASVRRKQRNDRIRVAAIASLILLTIASLGAAWFAEHQRDNAQQNLSRALASLANEELVRGYPAKAARLALAALPMQLDAPKRAYSPAAFIPLLNSVQHLRERRRFVDNHSVDSIAFSPDGRTLATGSWHSTEVLFWNTASGEQISMPTQHEKGVASVAFSPDGRTLATGSWDGTVQLWNASGERIGSLTHEDSVLSVAFSPDGRMLATGSDDGKARLWEKGSASAVVLHGHDGPVWSAAFSPDGQTLATVSSDGTIRLWEVASREEFRTLRSNEEVSRFSRLSVVFSPDGQTLATNLEGGKVQLWDVATGEKIEVDFEEAADVESIAFSPDGRTLAASLSDKTVRLWDVASGVQIDMLRGHEAGVTSVVFNPADGGRTLATCSQDKTARLWQVASDKEVGLLRGHGHWDDAVISVAFSPDGRTLAIASKDNTAKLWEVATGEEIKGSFGHNEPVTSAIFSPDGRTLATGFLRTARLRDVASDKEVVLQGLDSTVLSLAFSPDGRTVATGSQDNTARMWEVSGKQIGMPLRHENQVTSTAFSPDGRTLATGSRDYRVRLWDVDSHKEIIPPLEGHDGMVTSIAFGPDGRTLATGSKDKTVRLWDVDSHKEIIPPLEGHDGEVTSIAFSPDGRTLATGSLDATARMWDVASGKEIGALRGHAYGVLAVAFSPDGRTLATGSGDGTARLWPLGQRLIDLACARVDGVPLSPSDKVRFGIGDEWCTPEVSGRLRARLGLDAAGALVSQFEIRRP